MLTTAGKLQSANADSEPSEQQSTCFQSQPDNLDHAGEAILTCIGDLCKAKVFSLLSIKTKSIHTP